VTDLDLIDRKIVAELMRDATLPIAQIAEKTGLSRTPCCKRMQKLEAAGVLTGRVALADPSKPGFGLTAVDVLGNDQLKIFAHELLKGLKATISIEWAHRAFAHSRLGVLVNAAAGCPWQEHNETHLARRKRFTFDGLDDGQVKKA